MRSYFSLVTLLPARATLTLVFATLALTACGAGLGPQRDLRSEHGSCEVACDHYEYCKGAPDPNREQACLSDCRTIFSEDGHVDGASLHELEGLSCRQLLSFIEGPGSRPPGSAQ